MHRLLVLVALVGCHKPGGEGETGHETDCTPSQWFADADGDGHGDATQSEVTCDAPAGTVSSSDDCDDTRAEVFPGVPELCDGVDGNCDGLEDVPVTLYDDVDGDTYGDDATADALCGPDASRVIVGGDCDDNDATVFSGAIETLGDATDQDCDGQVDAAPWQGATSAWDEPRNVIVGRVDRHVVLTTGATSTDLSPYEQSGMTLLFDPTDRREPVGIHSWFVPNNFGKVQTLGARVDMVTSGADFYVLGSYIDEPTCSPAPCTPTPPSSFTIAKLVYYDTVQSDYRDKIAYRMVATLADEDVDVDLRLAANGDVWGLGCGTSTLSFVVANNTPAFEYVSKGCYGAGNCDAGTLAPAAPTQCFLDLPATGTVATAAVCDGAGCSSYALDGTLAVGVVAPAGAQPYAALATAGSGVDWQNGFRTIVPAVGPGFALIEDGQAPRTLLGGFTVKAAAASKFDGVLYLVAVVADQDGDTIDDVLLAYGPEAGDVFTTTAVPFVASDGHAEFVFDPDEVSVYADADGVFLAVAGRGTGADCLSPDDGRCDLVAWQALALP